MCYLTYMLFIIKWVSWCGYVLSDIHVIDHQMSILMWICVIWHTCYWSSNEYLDVDMCYLTYMVLIIKWVSWCGHVLSDIHVIDHQMSILMWICVIWHTCYWSSNEYLDVDMCYLTYMLLIIKWVSWCGYVLSDIHVIDHQMSILMWICVIWHTCYWSSNEYLDVDMYYLTYMLLIIKWVSWCGYVLSDIYVIDHQMSILMWICIIWHTCYWSSNEYLDVDMCYLTYMLLIIKWVSWCGYVLSDIHVIDHQMSILMWICVIGHTCYWSSNEYLDVDMCYLTYMLLIIKWVSWCGYVLSDIHVIDHQMSILMWICVIWHTCYWSLNEYLDVDMCYLTYMLLIIKWVSWCGYVLSDIHVIDH